MFQKRYLRVFLTNIENKDVGSKRRQLYCVLYTNFLKISLLECKGKHLLCIMLNIKYFEIARRYILVHLVLHLVVLSNILKLSELLHL